MLSKYTLTTVGWRGPEHVAELGVAVADGLVEAELVDEHPALVLGAGDADHPTTGTLGQLADEVADGARCRGDEHGLAGLRTPTASNPK